MSTNTLSRSLHDVGLAAWFGGTLANATALNPAAAEADSAQGTGAVANVGWDRWTPVNAAAIAAHLVGSIGMLASDAGRVSAQKGAGRTVVLKTGLTVAALGVTAYSRALGKRVSQQTAVPAESGTEPSAHTPSDVAAAQRQLKLLQWAVPALTGALVVLSAQAGEEQRPATLLEGVTAKFPGLA
ncbi:hypothetical protein [Nocardioides xinjiangensis]|uniref:hypothetical protein n=1 Tax=Nocardioides xinjiangensis TaxID=2817376 RepID=UPI001B3120B8|nr:MULTISPECIES: hypothetical protein [unclassified Nocardioides]